MLHIAAYWVYNIQQGLSPALLRLAFTMPRAVTKLLMFSFLSKQGEEKVAYNQYTQTRRRKGKYYTESETVHEQATREKLCFATGRCSNCKLIERKKWQSISVQHKFIVSTQKHIR